MAHESFGACKPLVRQCTATGSANGKRCIFTFNNGHINRLHVDSNSGRWRNSGINQYIVIDSDVTVCEYCQCPFTAGGGNSGYHRWRSAAIDVSDNQGIAFVPKENTHISVRSCNAVPDNLRINSFAGNHIEVKPLEAP